ncbi:hypothetical protein EDB82DRAFT_481096 [Fusarium venenatum]|uniref:uncharacterized protein n=1 Tax=Fusarium venenatum TaxID=56646 RepID=UPI001D70075B|nr:hypothetical protein EDB82DRAFT_481096 [Fusarium venenatum]
MNSSSTRAGNLQPTKETSNTINTYLTPGYGGSRTRRRASRHQNASNILQRQTEYGSEEIDIALHGPSFNMMNQDQAMQSCPELGCRHSHSWHSAPTSRDPHSNTYQSTPLSQPITPTSLLHRLDGRLRQTYFESPFGSSRSLSVSSLDDSADDSRSQAGKERRRRARDSEVNRHHSNSSADDSASVPIMSAPAVHEGTRQLAVAGVVLGALELDRLSLMARVDEEKGKFRSRSKSKSKSKQKQV